MDKRTFKDALYAQFARIGAAVSSPKRLEIVDLLCQGEKSVEVLAEQAALTIGNASAHLKACRGRHAFWWRRGGHGDAGKRGGEERTRADPVWRSVARRSAKDRPAFWRYHGRRGVACGAVPGGATRRDRSHHLPRAIHHGHDRRVARDHHDRGAR